MPLASSTDTGRGLAATLRLPGAAAATASTSSRVTPQSPSWVGQAEAGDQRGDGGCGVVVGADGLTEPGDGVGHGLER